jgi:hypothetical protein
MMNRFLVYPILTPLPATIFVVSTSTVLNNLTITAPPTTGLTTVRPQIVTATRFENLTTTLATTTQVNSTTTLTVGPICRIPMRPCTYTTQGVPMPSGYSNHTSAPGQSHGGRLLQKRAPDQRTTTITANTNVVTATITFTTTASPQTILGGEIVSTTTAGYTHTDVVVSTVYATAFVTQTIVGRIVTQTVMDVQSAFAAECTNKGGYLG